MAKVKKFRTGDIVRLKYLTHTRELVVIHTYNSDSVLLIGFDDYLVHFELDISDNLIDLVRRPKRTSNTQLETGDCVKIRGLSFQPVNILFDSTDNGCFYVSKTGSIECLDLSAKILEKCPPTALKRI